MKDSDGETRAEISTQTGLTGETITDSIGEPIQSIEGDGDSSDGNS